jgi:hypothetical protein
LCIAIHACNSKYVLVNSHKEYNLEVLTSNNSIYTDEIVLCAASGLFCYPLSVALLTSNKVRPFCRFPCLTVSPFDAIVHACSYGHLKMVCIY